MKTTIPDQTIRSLLCGIEKPGRYSGGEYGARSSQHEGALVTGISYPDLYEIGMSNNAIRILYAMLNAIEGVVCERVFAPAPDFEEALQNADIPLYTLESRYPLSELDILAFSIGYELTFTALITILERGGIPLQNSDRSAADPIILAGGPAAVNPVPYGSIIDAVWIGESEEVLPSIMKKMAACRKTGGSRDDLLSILGECPHIWIKGRKEAASRGVWNGFGCTSPGINTVPVPVPSIRTVQAQGVVEIMRGCPNGCRFCNAGSIYKPVREKEIDQICREIDYLVFHQGLREITLSSLSSGDYSCIQQLLDVVNKRYQGLHVSFSLPSLKVDTFTLSLLSELSRVRKSGLTFAVETPENSWQRGINKQAGRDKIIGILREAKSAGWKLAKFYFMIGLPVLDSEEDGTEVESIISFIDAVQREVKLSLNVNIGVFVPKPHTPFQWAGQLSDSEAIPKLTRIKNAFRNRWVKVNYHSPFLSMLEGILSRGDERAGDLFLAAYRRGARLDAWEEYLNKAAWQSVLETASWDVVGETCRSRSEEELLPWDTIDMGISKAFLRRENERARAGEGTPPCAPDCSHNCGVCREKVQVRAADAEQAAPPTVTPVTAAAKEGFETCLFGFRKDGSAVYTAHLDVVRIMEHTFQRAGMYPRYTEGFNPKPRFEFAHPLSLGIASREEIGLVELGNADELEDLIDLLNPQFPAGFAVTRLKKIVRLPGKKKRSLMSLFWGAEYALTVQHQTGEKGEAEALESITAFIDRGDSVSRYYSYKQIDNGLILRVQNANRKDASLKYLLKEAAGIETGCGPFSVERIRLFADQNGTPADYFSVY